MTKLNCCNQMPTAGYAYAFAISAYPFTISEYPFTISEYPFTISEYPFAISEYPFAISEYPFAISEYPFAISEYPFTISANSLGIIQGRVVSYKQRKTSTAFQSLSPFRGEVWRGVKSHTTKREIKTYVFFFFRMKPPCIGDYSKDFQEINYPFCGVGSVRLSAHAVRVAFRRKVLPAL
jgi:hypothetical protein